MYSSENSADFRTLKQAKPTQGRTSLRATRHRTLILSRSPTKTMPPSPDRPVTLFVSTPTLPYLHTRWWIYTLLTPYGGGQLPSIILIVMALMLSTTTPVCAPWKGPLGDHAPTGHDELVKRDNCWGHKHNDYEGGYYKIEGLGAFGSEVYQSS